jgi:two-component system, NarL family, response regulator NreC
MATIRVVLADDHTILRAGLQSLLSAQADIDVVGEADDGAAAIELIQNVQPDVVLLDITMPGMNGLDATREIKRMYPATQVLILTMHDDDAYLRQALHAGASGFVLKRADDRDLLSAIRAVAKGEIYVHPSMSKALVGGIMPARPRAQKDPQHQLTARELEVLQLLAQGYTNQEIAHRLVLSVKTVETHRAHVMEKLGLKTRAELVRFALQESLL